MSTPAPLFTDTFALCQWLLGHLDGADSLLARNLCDNALKLLEAVALALKDRLRDERLAEADERLIALRLHLRLAGETGLLEQHAMLHALTQADGIGRQLGGWQRALESA